MMAYITAITRFKNGRLVAEREKRGFTQGGMAKFLGINYTQYNSYENFSVMPNEKKCLMIASKLEVTPEELFDDYAKVYKSAELMGTNVIRKEIEKEQFELLSSDTVDMLPAAKSDQEIDRIREDLSETLSIVLGTLKEREEKTLRMYYGIGTYPHKLGEIAEKLGLSRERARQIKEKALRRIRYRDREGVNSPDMIELKSVFHDLLADLADE